jgi:hypothetical protein
VTEHTALPWHHVVFILQDGDEIGVVHWEPDPGDGLCSTLGKMELKPADAEFIARACNAHEELLVAVKFCLDEMSRNGDSREVRERACAVIAKAEGRR